MTDDYIPPEYQTPQTALLAAPVTAIVFAVILGAAYLLHYFFPTLFVLR